MLADGPVAVKQLKADASDAGHAWRTVNRAKADIGVRSTKKGGFPSGGWQWEMPA